MNSEYLAVAGGIFKDGQEIVLKGINWFGFEGDKVCLNGLWVGASAYWAKLTSFVDQMDTLGFNAWRIPLSPQALDGNTRAPQDWVGDKSSMDVLHDFLKYTKTKGHHVLLDLHNCSSKMAFTDKPGPAIGSCSFYTIDMWHGDLLRMADIANQYDHVIGLDLFNEPFGYKFEDWARICANAAEAIHKVAPQLLFFVEGVGNESDNGGKSAFWGENLTELSKYLPVSNKLVVSPHVYGPSVSQADYFQGGDFPGNMAAIWEKHYGYLESLGYTLAIGEWGGRFTDKDWTWANAFVKYLNMKGINNNFFWCMNPNSGDTGGILQDDWATVNQWKLDIINYIKAPARELPPPQPAPVKTPDAPVVPPAPVAVEPPTPAHAEPKARTITVDLTVGTWPIKGTITIEE